ncbi:MAG: DUF5011 domain-containing protein, partial [Candidatus Komeilibacteria bacterium]|nr:DUF5011 domain-containing protein [Candidatus Komeilibacteria bacterium]
SGSYAYTVSDHDNLNDGVNPPDFRIIDVSDPANPFVKSTLELYPSNGPCELFCNFGPNTLTLSGGYVYIGSDDALIVVNVADPENPQEVLRVSAPRIESVQISGDQLFAVTHFDGVRVYNITDPANPVFLNAWGQSSLYGDGNANRGLDIAVTSTHAYVARSTTVADTSAYVGVYQIKLTARFCIDGTEADCYNGSATEIAVVPFGALAAGASQAVSVDWTAEEAGEYTLYLCADVNGPVGAVAESDETNNCSSLSFTVTALDDENTQPVITLLGSDPMDLIIGSVFTDPGATALDPEDGDITDSIVIGGDEVSTTTAGVYIITYNVTDSDGAAAEEVTRTVNVNESEPTTECSDGIDNDDDGLIDAEDPACHTDQDADNEESYDPDLDDESNDPQEEELPQCSDGIDNDGDGKIDFPDDPGCENADDNDETDPAPEPEPEPTPSGGGGGGGGGGTVISGPLSIGYQVSGGQVAGAVATGTPVLPIQPVPKECTQYLFGFIKEGEQNDPAEVRKLQTFLRTFEGFGGIEVNGVYDKVTQDAVDAFQERYFDDVLAPWGHDKATTYVYLTTRKKVNEIYCRGEKQFPLNAAQQEEVKEFRAWLLSLKSGEQINLSAPEEKDEMKTLKEILKDSVEIGGAGEVQPAAVGASGEEGANLLQGAVNGMTNFLKRLKNMF